MNRKISPVFYSGPQVALSVAEAKRFRRLLRRWARIWKTPQLSDKTSIEWSLRLTRTLGRAYPQKMLIRLNSRLRQPKYDELVTEVFCHEAAHLAAVLLHGPTVAPHGETWRRLVQLAGYEPRTGLHVPELVQDALPSPRKSARYEHFCPVCHARRYAKRRQTAWRCGACRRLGLDGRLLIREQPASSEALDE